MLSKVSSYTNEGHEVLKKLSILSSPESLSNLQSQLQKSIAEGELNLSKEEQTQYDYLHLKYVDQLYKFSYQGNTQWAFVGKNGIAENGLGDDISLINNNYNEHYSMRFRYPEDNTFAIIILLFIILSLSYHTYKFRKFYS